MNVAQRKIYFATLWPAACRVNGWNRNDNIKRIAVLNDCMRAIGAPAVESSSELGPDEVTALFTYLKFLANQASLELSARWLDCQEDYEAFNRARQADWHESETYGRGKNKLDRNRFAGATSAQGEALDSFDPEAIRKRHLTMANRHKKKLQREGRETALPQDNPQLVASSVAPCQDFEGDPF
jgi:hypothetical protein